jgi:hypothetical protein
MISFRSYVASGLLLGMFAAPALSETKTAEWGQVGSWAIRVDQTLGNGCFASQLYEDGTYLRMGFDQKKQSIFILFGNPAWRSLEAGKMYQITFLFDDQKKYTGEMNGILFIGKVFLDHSNLSADFAKDFMQRSTVRVSYRGSQITHLSLRYTYAAMAEVLNCQKELTGLGGQGGSTQTSDPFAGNSRSDRSGDPFAR